MLEAPEVPVAPFSDATLPTDPEIEAKLSAEIQSLWTAHIQSKATVQRTKEELEAIRRDLGKRLFEMKTVLVRTGRGGGWASYLRSASLPRASADRYVRQHEATLNPSQTKRLSESISEPTADDVRRLVTGLLPRLRRVLTTPSWVEWFLVEVAFQLEAADESPTGGGGEGASHVATSESYPLQGAE